MPCPCPPGLYTCPVSLSGNKGFFLLVSGDSVSAVFQNLLLVLNCGCYVNFSVHSFFDGKLPLGCKFGG